MKLQDFYDDKYLGQKRRLSRELDFGCWWRGKRHFPNYRITWVQSTGEIIRVELWNEDCVILGTIENEAEVEIAFQGWAKECGLPNSLAWIQARTIHAMSKLESPYLQP
jgi:hypothetical protein